MDDDLRTLIQNFLEGDCAVDIDESEEAAERLAGLLNHKGYTMKRFGSDIELVNYKKKVKQ